MLWVGASHHHLSFPGTVSLSATTYILVLKDMLQGLLDSGFRRIVLLNAHSGNSVPSQVALNDLQIANRRAMPEMWLAAVNWFELITTAEGFRQKKIIHACEWETSMILAIRPDLVDDEDRPATRAPGNSTFHSPDYSKPSKVFVPRTIEQSSASGAFGYPEEASAEKGEFLFGEAAAQFVAFVREFARYGAAGQVSSP
jgi:creatinine amidohydrolase